MIKFDYDSVKDRIVTSLSTKSEWAQLLEYGVDMNLLESIIQELVYETQYKEYLTYENWWSLARNKSSLLVEAPVHGYVVPRKKGSFGYLKVSISKTFSAPPSNAIQLPKYFQFSNGSTYFLTDQINTITTIDNYVVIRAKQGESKSIQFSAVGSQFETKEIIDANVDNDLYDLYVNDVLWTKVNTLFDYTANDLVYEIITDPSFSKVTLKFGNDVFGKKLTAGDTVLFQYSSTLGKNGNVGSLDNVTIVESQAFDNTGTAVKIYVTNTTAFVGGEDYPSIEEIRDLSPKVYQTGDRASSVDDYLAIIKQFNYISKANVWGVYTTLKDDNLDPWTFIATQENVVHTALLNAAFENLSNAEKTQIIDDLHTKNDPTDIIQFETVEKIRLLFYVDAIVKNSSYNLSEVKGYIEDALINNYSIEYTDFNGNIYYSDFETLIDSVVGVRNHNSYILSLKETEFSERYICGFNLPMYPIQGNSVEIYIKEKTQPSTSYVLMATSDANGIITGETGYNTTGSSINLVNGNGILLVNSGLSLPYTSYDIKFVYGSSRDDLILNKRYHIYAYEASYITVSYPTT
jgi:hypothetical protein